MLGGSSPRSMGLGRGGEIRQKIYPDPYGLDVWKSEPSVIERIHIVSSEDFKQITGFDALATPVTMEAYRRARIPWFELPDKHLNDTKGSSVFKSLNAVSDGKATEKSMYDKLK